MAFVVSSKPCNANFNPAVTLAMCVRKNKRYQASLFWLYFKAQMVGAFVAYVSLYLLNGEIRKPFVPPEHSTADYLRIILSEAVGVFILVISVLKITGPNTSYSSNTLDKQIIILVFAYLCGMYAPSSCFSGNLGFTIPRAVLGLFLCDHEGLRYCILWVIGDVFGSLVGVWLYDNFVEPQIIFNRMSIWNKNQRKELNTVEMIEFNHGR